MAIEAEKHLSRTTKLKGASSTSQGGFKEQRGSSCSNYQRPAYNQSLVSSTKKERGQLQVLCAPVNQIDLGVALENSL